MHLIEELAWFDFYLFNYPSNSAMYEVCRNFFESIKLLYVCDFFCGREICKKVLNTLEILDFIYKERVSSDQTYSPWIGRSSPTEGIP